MASDRDTLAEPTPVGYVHIERAGHGWQLVEDVSMAPDSSLIAAGWANETVGVVYLHDEITSWYPPAYIIDSPEELDTLPAGAVVVNLAGRAWQADRRLGVGPEEHRWAMVFSTTMRNARHVLAHGAVTVVHIPFEEAQR